MPIAVTWRLYIVEHWKLFVLMVSPKKNLYFFAHILVEPIFHFQLLLRMILHFLWFSFQDCDRQSPTQVVTEMCGFVTILCGTFLHKTKDMTDGIIFIIPLLSHQWAIFWAMILSLRLYLWISYALPSKRHLKLSFF